MTAHAGTLFLAAIVTDKLSWFTEAPVLIGNTPMIGGIYLNGFVTGNVPNGRKKHNGTASLYPGSFETYFNRPIFIPGQIKAGAIISDLIYPVEVYLAYNDRGSVEVLDPTVADPTLTLTGPPPGNYSTGSRLKYTLHIESEAETSSVDELIRYNVTDSPDGLLVVTGTRTLIWRYAAQEGASEIFEFNTSVTESYLSEQRTKLRTHPVQRYRYSMKLTQAEQEEILDLARNGAKVRWTFPLWHEARPITSPVNQGTTALDVDISNTTMPLEESIAIYKDGLVEVVKINTITDTQVILTNPVLSTFGTGALAMPVRSGLIENGIDLTIGKGLNGQLTVEFTLKGEPVSTDEPATVTLLDKEVLEKPSQVDVKRNIKQQFETFHNGIAEPLHYLKRSETDKTIEIHWKMYSEADRYYVRSLVDRLAGQYRPVWVPTFRNDILPVQTLPEQTHNLECYIPTLEFYEPIKAIAIIKIATQEVFCFEVSTLTEKDTTHSISTVEPFPETFEPGEIMICFMKTYRANTDKAEIKHFRGRSEFTLTMKEVDE